MKKQFFLMAVLAVMIGGFLLIWESPPESFLRLETNSVDELPSADSYMKGVTSYKFSNTGNQQYRLESTNAFFYNQESMLVLENPTFKASQVDTTASELSIIADRGLLANDRETIELTGKVSADWSTEEGRNLLTAKKLSYFVNDHLAKADRGFKLKTPQAEVTGKNFATDLKAGITTITSNVNAIYEPN